MSDPARPSLATVYWVAGIAFVFSVPYALLGKDAPSSIQLFALLAPMIAVGIWFHRYARHAKQAIAFDWGFFYWLAWPVLIPLYAVRIQGPRGWRLVGLLAAVLLGPRVALAVIAALAGH